ncbi:hypothetical protein Q8F55_008101 [Vanrija albida]|uniref:Zinc knuckle-domain-containing protein n=1 Tax=Vanrija albida TaxID=181172 RepID=A0ABR3PW99_9TREE
MFSRTNLPKQLQGTKASGSTRCQKCLKLGHHTYECKNPRPYVPRPSRTKQLASGAKARDTPSVVTPDEFKTGYGVGLADKILKAKEAERASAARGRGGGYGGRDRSASPRRRRDSPDSDSDSTASRSPPRRARRRYSSSPDSERGRTRHRESSQARTVSPSRTRSPSPGSRRERIEREGATPKRYDSSPEPRGRRSPSDSRSPSPRRAP